MDSSFRAVITVTEDGKVSGKVIDLMNSEEYEKLHLINFTGAYISKVRNSYMDILNDIALSCTDNLYFFSNQANRITEKIHEIYDIYPDFPWKDETYRNAGTFRHTDSRKWFALIMDIRRDALLKNKDMKKVDVINLKINPSDSEKLASINGIFPGYHMNHRNWISVVLNDTLNDEKILELVNVSFSLT